jgi:hypothetical protein
MSRTVRTFVLRIVPKLGGHRPAKPRRCPAGLHDWTERQAGLFECDLCGGWELVAPGAKPPP